MTPKAERFETVKDWFKENAKVSMIVPILKTDYGIVRMLLDRIDGINEATGRIYTRQHGAFYYSGKNCFHPKGQTTMQIPTWDNLQFAASKKQWMYGEDEMTTERESYPGEETLINDILENYK